MNIRQGCSNRLAHTLACALLCIMPLWGAWSLSIALRLSSYDEDIWCCEDISCVGLAEPWVYRAVSQKVEHE